MGSNTTPQQLAESTSEMLKQYPKAHISFLLAKEIFPSRKLINEWAEENEFLLIIEDDKELITVKRRIRVKANPRCKYCLGSGQSHGFYAGVIHVCSCVTEQLSIIITDKDYSIPQIGRYEPGSPKFVKE